MASTNYVRGRAKEYAVKAALEAQGYTCTRSASSQGLWDENCQKLRDLPVAPNCRKELWLYAAGQGLVEVRDLKLPKPDARTAEGKAARAQSREQAAASRPLLPRRRRSSA
jgi:hypothetical protein